MSPMWAGLTESVEGSSRPKRPSKRELLYLIAFEMGRCFFPALGHWLSWDSRLLSLRLELHHLSESPAC